jgi:GT2 family glycosyltransferase
VAGVIPVLGIPCIGRLDLLEACVASIDETVGRLVIVDNSPRGLGDAAVEAVCPPTVDDLCVTRPPSNLGFGGSVNHIIKTHADAPWWCIANADVVFGPGDLLRLSTTMTGARWVGITDWRVFGLTFEAVETVGLFDENFYPAYCEDADYEYRCTLAGVEWGAITGTTSHVGSVTIQENHYARRNDSTYPANRAYYRAKWGGELRGGETYSTPFGEPASANARLDLRRLRDQRW